MKDSVEEAAMRAANESKAGHADGCGVHCLPNCAWDGVRRAYLAQAAVTARPVRLEVQVAPPAFAPTKAAVRGPPAVWVCAVSCVDPREKNAPRHKWDLDGAHSGLVCLGCAQPMTRVPLPAREVAP